MLAGEMVMQRTASTQWAHRLQAARAMGLNTIALTLPWNQFEKQQGIYDFESANNNIKKFLQLCMDNSLSVLIRPGPYIGSSIDAGGIPIFLLDRPEIIRSTDADFVQAYESFFGALVE